MGMTSRDIIGMHTRGSAVLKKNWAIYLNSTKIKWIAEILETQEDRLL